MLALASLLERLRDDPGTVGKRYQLTVRAPDWLLGAIRDVPGVDAAGRALRDRGGRLVPARRAAQARRLPGRPHRVRGAAAGRGPARAGAGRDRGRARAGRRARPAARLDARRPAAQRRRGALPRGRDRARAGELGPDRLGAAATGCWRATRTWSPGSSCGSTRAPTARRSTRDLIEIGAPPRTASAATTRNGEFLAVLAAVLRGVGLAVGLVCLYALVQALTMTARERRGAVALLRACGGDARAVATVLAGAAAAVALPAAVAGIALEWAVFGPLVARLAAGFASLPLAPAPGHVAIVLPACSRSPPGRPRSWRGACCASPSSRGCGRSDAPRRRRRRPRRARARARRLRRRRARAAAPAAGSTLRATLTDPDGDGFLERGPAMPLAERRDLGGGGEPGREIARFGQITDAHVRDEESPARVPFLDRLGLAVRARLPPAGGRDRPGARRRRARARRRAPAGRRGHGRPRRQRAGERARPRDRRAARRPRRPVQRRARYEGVQEGDNPDPYYYRPDNDAPRHPGLTAAAQRPFTATGLDAPWFPVLGNHDALVQGEVPSTPAIEALATGSRMLTDLDRDVRPPTDEASAPAVVDALLGDPAGLPGRTREVTPDPRRRTLTPAQAVAKLRAAAPGAGTVAGRLDYTFDIGAARARDRARHGPPRGRLARRRGARSRCAGCEQRLRRGRRPPRRRLLPQPARQPPTAARPRWPPSATPATSSPRSPATATATRSSPTRAASGCISTASLADFPQQSRMFCLREVGGRRASCSTPGWSTTTAAASPARRASSPTSTPRAAARSGFAGRRADRNARLYLP